MNIVVRYRLWGFLSILDWAADHLEIGSLGTFNVGGKRLHHARNDQIVGALLDWSVYVNSKLDLCLIFMIDNVLVIFNHFL